MKTAVIIFPGSNCDQDVRTALCHYLGSEPVMLWHRETSLPSVDLVVIPGGFSYGDYLRPGSIAGHSPVMIAVAEEAKKGLPVLGICNGFQILTETGLLPGTLIRNACLRFICRDAWLRVESTDSVFTKNYCKNQVILIPVAHHDGNYYADEDTVAKLEDSDRVAFRYCDKDGRVLADSNLNGSRNNIAGIFNKQRNVLGMMPHPERASDPKIGKIDGSVLFDGLIDIIAT